jgi:transcriptional regulator with XRE-family HTH domain
MSTNLLKPPIKPNERLRQQRRRRHWTQADLADKLYQVCSPGERGVASRGNASVGMVSRWERGEHQPSAYWQKKLCEVFKLPPEELGLLEEAPVPAQKGVSSPPFAAPAELSFHERLVQYLDYQQARLCDSLASGSMYLRVGDIIGTGGLFVPPPWEGTIEADPNDSLSESLTDLLCQRQSILLLGEAGQGKSTILKQVFVLLSLQFKRDRTLPFPVYITLREIVAVTGNALDILWEQVSVDFPLEYDDFLQLARNKRIVFLYDGFDEMRGSITQQSVNERAASKLFTFPSLLSCRKSFFDYYLAYSPLKQIYARHVELLSLPLGVSLKHYIVTFCEQRQQRENHAAHPSAVEIIDLLESNKELRDLAQRPLFLLMILEIFPSTRKMEGSWNLNKLYRNYTESWLKNEAAKPDSLLRWSEKQALLQELAWHTYHTYQRSTISYEELIHFVDTFTSRYPERTEMQLVDDLCFRTLLTVDGEEYAFLHKSIQEFYVARYVWERMRSREETAWEKIEQALNTSLPFDVATFLKQAMKESTLAEKEAITGNLVRVYQRNQGQDPQTVVIRQQASHYLTSLDFSKANQFLEQICETEPDKWVQRGIMVGLALYCRRQDILDRYVQIIRRDQEAASINVGYHLVYYGDCPPGTDYDIENIVQCEKTISALFRHLRDEHYKIGWSLDILTLVSLIEQQGISILSENDWMFFDDFCQKEYSLGPTFQEEKTRLEEFLRRR